MFDNSEKAALQHLRDHVMYTGGLPGASVYVGEGTIYDMDKKLHNVAVFWLPSPVRSHERYCAFEWNAVLVKWEYVCEADKPANLKTTTA